MKYLRRNRRRTSQQSSTPAPVYCTCGLMSIILNVERVHAYFHQLFYVLFERCRLSPFYLGPGENAFVGRSLELCAFHVLFFFSSPRPSSKQNNTTPPFLSLHPFIHSPSHHSTPSLSLSLSQSTHFTTTTPQPPSSSITHFTGPTKRKGYSCLVLHQALVPEGLHFRFTRTVLTRGCCKRGVSSNQAVAARVAWFLHSFVRMHLVKITSVFVMSSRFLFPNTWLAERLHYSHCSSCIISRSSHACLLLGLVTIEVRIINACPAPDNSRLEPLLV